MANVDLHRPRRFTLQAYIRTMAATSGAVYEYPWCTATPEGYTGLSPFRVIRMSVGAFLAGTGEGEGLTVGFYKTSFSSAFMELATTATGWYWATDTSTVTDFSTSEEFLCRVKVNWTSGGAKTVTSINVTADCEYI